MDRLGRLQVLTGDERIVNNDTKFRHSMLPPPAHANMIESTGSENTVDLTPKGIGMLERTQIRDTWGSLGPGCLEYPQMKLGQLAAEDESFIPFLAIKRFPYVYIAHKDRRTVVEAFFDQGKLLNNIWDWFYIHRENSGDDLQPILLIPAKQFEDFIAIINCNCNLDTRLTIPKADGDFQFTFDNNGTPLPRYLGRSTTREMMEDLKTNIPPSYYRLSTEPESIEPNDASLEAFRNKIELVLQAQKGKTLAKKMKKAREQVAKQESWKNSVKRVQRYLGIRESRRDPHAVVRTAVEENQLKWAECGATIESSTTTLSPPSAFSPDQLAQFSREQDVVFICIDVEAYERNTNIITEIGISTLDTRDLTATVPGERGTEWMKLIQARHFRIREYIRYRNTEFVIGCPDSFEFGASEFVSIKDAPQVVASCFKAPFCSLDQDTSGVDLPKRNIVVVGHDVGADVRFLRSIGYDVYNLSNMIEQVDTSVMWRYLNKESNPRKLAIVLAELGIEAWNLHNAGNDAAYTLQAMIAMAIKFPVDRELGKQETEHEKGDTVLEQNPDTAEKASERQNGWSSEGVPELLAVPAKRKAKKVVTSLPWAYEDALRKSSQSGHPNINEHVSSITPEQDYGQEHTLQNNEHDSDECHGQSGGRERATSTEGPFNPSAPCDGSFAISDVEDSMTRMNISSNLKRQTYDPSKW